jgi:NDP-sugar pyrophosphorylase family protein
MILAAGLGTRMELLTIDRAKPALTVLDEPVILSLVRTLACQGIDEVVVNTHAHPETVRETLRAAPGGVRFSHEPILLGSGGGILAAREQLGDDEPFLVANGDMLINLDVAALIERHRRLGTAATLVLRDEPRKARFGTLGYDRAGRVTRITDLVSTGSEEGSGLFAGVHVLEPEIFDWMPETTSFDIVRHVYVDAVGRGDRLGVFLHPQGARWLPVGTPGDLLEANLQALSGWLAMQDEGERAVHVAPGAQIRGDLVGPAWVGPKAEVEAGSRVGPWTVLGTDVRVGREAQLERVVVLSGSRVPPEEVVRRAIIGPGGVSSCD